MKLKEAQELIDKFQEMFPLLLPADASVFGTVISYNGTNKIWVTQERDPRGFYHFTAAKFIINFIR